MKYVEALVLASEMVGTLEGSFNRTQRHWIRIAKNLAKQLPHPWHVILGENLVNVSQEGRTRRVRIVFGIGTKARVDVIASVEGITYFVYHSFAIVPSTEVNKLLEVLYQEIEVDITEPWPEWSDFFPWIA